MTLDSAIMTTTTKSSRSSGINNMHSPHKQKAPSPIQFKHAIIQSSGHKDAHLHERKHQEKDIPNNKRIHQQYSDDRSPPKRFRYLRTANADIMSFTSILTPVEFLMTDEAIPHKVERNLIVADSGMDHSEDGKTVFHKLFEKQLTKTDVGGRFIVPKQHAHCFSEANSDKVAVTLEVLDNQKKWWKFQSCRIANQITVLTIGWSQFVMEMGLRKMDVVVFYRFEEDQDGHKNQYYMIDIIPFDSGSHKVVLRNDANNEIENQKTKDRLDMIQKSMEKKMEQTPKKILKRGCEGVEEPVEKSSTREHDIMKEEGNSLGEKQEVQAADTKHEQLKKGVWLFGVQISS